MTAIDNLEAFCTVIIGLCADVRELRGLRQELDLIAIERNKLLAEVIILRETVKQPKTAEAAPEADEHALQATITGLRRDLYDSREECKRLKGQVAELMAAPTHGGNA